MKPQSWELATSDGRASVYACGWCNTISSTKEQADACCVCTWPGCGQRRKRHYVYCDEHYEEAAEQRRAKDRAAYLALPFATSEAIAAADAYYVDGSFHYYDLDEALDIVLDNHERDEWRYVEAHVCRKSAVATPSLHDWLNDAWGCEYEDWDGLPAEVDAYLVGVQKAIEEMAPDIYTPYTKSRIDIFGLLAARTKENDE